MKASTYFPSLSPHAATMTIMKCAELLLVYHKQSSVTNVEEKSKAAQPLSDRDIDSLQYLGGYVLRSIFRKLKKSSKVDSSESQQMIAVLEASRIKVDTKHKLVSTLNRGGLWAAHGDMQEIFVCCETQFRQSVNSTQVRKIESRPLVEKLLKSITVNSKFNTLLEKTKLHIKDYLAKDILFKIIELFIKVRTFSHAKDIVQNYKAKQYKNKSKALRKDIKRSTEKSIVQKLMSD